MDVKFIGVGKVAIAVLIVSPWYLLRMLANINGQICLGGTKERKWLVEKRKVKVVFVQEKVTELIEANFVISYLSIVAFYLPN
jgi:hypothetical protein